MRTCAEQEDNLGTVANHALSEEQAAEEECPMYSKRAVLVSQATLTEAIPGVTGLSKNAVTTLGTTEGDSGAKKANNRLWGILQRLFNRTLDEKLNAIEFKEHLVLNIEERTLSSQQ